MNRLGPVCLLTGGLLIANGCATSKNVVFTSDPAGAAVSIENKRGDVHHTATTPGDVVLPRGEAYFATFDLAGYHTVTTPVLRKADLDALGSAVGAALVIGVSADTIASVWAAAPLLGMAHPLISGALILAPVGMAVYGAQHAPPKLPENLHVDLIPEDEPPPENAGDMAYWRNKAEEERKVLRGPRMSEEGPRRGYSVKGKR